MKIKEEATHDKQNLITFDFMHENVTSEEQHKFELYI